MGGTLVGAFIVIWILCGVIAGIIANNKGNSGVMGFLAGVLFGPLGILFEAVHPVPKKAQEQKNRRDGMKKCPQCAEWIQNEAKVCRYCGFNPASANP